MEKMRVIALAAMSLDGCITQHDRKGTAFASSADQRFFQAALADFDCCIFGSKTFEVSHAAIVRHLTAERLRIVLTRSPEKYAALRQPEMLEFTDAPPETILAELQQRRKRRCAILGGSDVYTLFLAQRLIDELWMTVEPRIFGEGTRLTSGRLDCSMRLISHERLAEDTLLLRYEII